MSVTEITFAIFCVICLGVGAIYFSQAREKARVEKIRKINTLRERHRRMQQLLHELPPQYLTNELRIMVLERSIETLSELGNLKADSKIQAEIKADNEMLKNIREKNPKFPPVKIKDEAAAKNVRTLLEILLKFVQTQAKKRKLDVASAKTYISQITFSAAQCKADLFVNRAEAANKIGKPRVAIHNYHNAVDALKELANHPQAVTAIKQYRANIKALEQAAEAQKEQSKQSSQAKMEGNDEWNSFLKEDDDPWKKKNAYDD